MFKGRYLRVLKVQGLESRKFKIKWTSKMYETGKESSEVGGRLAGENCEACRGYESLACKLQYA